MRKRPSVDGLATRIVQTADTCGGEPRFDGTRIPIRVVLDFLDAGDSEPDVLAGYPGLTSEDLAEARRYRENH